MNDQPDPLKEQELAGALGLPTCGMCKGSGIQHLGATEVTINLGPAMNGVAVITLRAQLCPRCCSGTILPPLLRKIVQGNVTLEDVEDIPF